MTMSDIRVVSVQKGQASVSTTLDHPIVLTSLNELSKAFKTADSNSELIDSTRDTVSVVTKENSVPVVTDTEAVNKEETVLAVDASVSAYNPIDVFNPMTAVAPIPSPLTLPVPQPKSEVPMSNENISTSSVQHKSSVVTPNATERATQQQISTQEKGSGVQPVAVDVSAPDMHSAVEDSNFFDLELTKFRFFLVLDLNFTMQDALSVKDSLTHFNGKSEEVSLFNPFRRRVTRKGKVVYPAGYLNTVIPEVVEHLTSVTQSPVFLFAGDAEKENVAKAFLSKVSIYILRKIDNIVDLNSPVFSLENGQSFNVKDFVSVQSWVSTETGYDDNGEENADIKVTTLNSAIRVVVPELVAKPNTDGMISFINSVHTVIINTLDEAEATYSDVVIALSTNSSAYFSNPAMSDLVLELVSSSMSDGEDEEVDVDEESGEEVVVGGSPFDFEVIGLSVQGLLDAVEAGNADTIFPTDKQSLLNVLGDKTEMVFCAYIPASDGYEDEEDYDDDDEGEEADYDEPDAIAESVSKTAVKGKLAKKSTTDSDLNEIDVLIKSALEKTLKDTPVASKKQTKADIVDEEEEEEEEEDSDEDETMELSEDSDGDEIEEDMESEESVEDDEDSDEDEDEDEDEDSELEEIDELEEIEETLTKAKAPLPAAKVSLRDKVVAKAQQAHQNKLNIKGKGGFDKRATVQPQVKPILKPQRHGQR